MSADSPEAPARRTALDGLPTDLPELAERAPLPPVPAAGEEVDVWWGAYAGRTLLPAVLTAVAATVVLAVAARLLGRIYQLPPTSARYLTEAVGGVLWLVLASRWLARLVTLNYRLTTRRLFVQRGFYGGPPPGIPLTRIEHVTVAQAPAEHWLGVGRVLVMADGTTTVLEGVRHPKHVAALIRSQVDLARREEGLPAEPAAGDVLST